MTREFKPNEGDKDKMLEQFYLQRKREEALMRAAQAYAEAHGSRGLVNPDAQEGKRYTLDQLRIVHTLKEEWGFTNDEISHMVQRLGLR